MGALFIQPRFRPRTDRHSDEGSEGSDAAQLRDQRQAEQLLAESNHAKLSVQRRPGENPEPAGAIQKTRQRDDPTGSANVPQHESLLEGHSSSGVMEEEA